MVLETIYVVRHGFRSNWVVDPSTGTYHAHIPSPTGIQSDPALASYGVQQAEQLAQRLTKLVPPVDVIYSSPFYRCLQTLKPTVEILNKKVVVENGLGEYYGRARFDHPSPATIDVLHKHFSFLSESYSPYIIPSKNGETTLSLHERCAYVLHRIIETLDADPSGPKTLLICTHAAIMIAVGRVLTGYMPEDENAVDFRAGTCALSVFKRKKDTSSSDEGHPVANGKDVDQWDPNDPEHLPAVEWKGGKGILGGWDCEVDGDCSHLENGEERNWYFWMEGDAK